MDKKISSCVLSGGCQTCFPLLAASVQSCSADTGQFLSRCPLHLTQAKHSESALKKQRTSHLLPIFSLVCSLSSSLYPSYGIGTNSALSMSFFPREKTHCFFRAEKGQRERFSIRAHRRSARARFDISLHSPVSPTPSQSLQ